MSDAYSDTIAALDYIRSELARRRTTLLQSQTTGAALSRRTRELCDELHTAIRSSRERVADLAQSATADGCRPPAIPAGADAAPRAADVSVTEPAMAKLQPGLPSARLRRVMAYIDLHLGEPISVRQLARLAGMSPSHFTALFRRSTGLSPHAYLLQRRVDRARDLVADESLTLAEIGCRLGFSSQAHFTTAFRKRFGMTPSVWRARERASFDLAAD